MHSDIWKIVRRFLSSAAMVFAVSVFSMISVADRAQSNVYPVAYGDYYGGYYVGWGWYPIVGGLWPWTYYGYSTWSPYGYSYYPVFGYQPYYETYGAIAFSPQTQRVGIAWGEYALSTAAYSAESYCAADDCQSVVWVRGGCAAIAKGVNIDQVSWGYHSSKYGARSYAMRACRAAGGEGCRIGAWVCSF